MTQMLTTKEIQTLLQVDRSTIALTLHLYEVFHLDQTQQTLVLSLVRRMADILAQIAVERTTLEGVSL